MSKHLGTDLVIQTPYGDSGHTTFFIDDEASFNKHKDEILEEKEVKVMKRINCRGAAIEACVTRHGTIVAPLMTELVGFKELTPYKGGWCGMRFIQMHSRKNYVPKQEDIRSNLEINLERKGTRDILNYTF